MIANVSARGKQGVKLVNVSLTAANDVLAIVGTPRDGTTLLFDLLAGDASPKSGVVARPARIARVTLDAPLPDAMRVDEVCALAATLRGARPEDHRPEKLLAPLHLESLAKRSTASLALDERRAIALAIALAAPVGAVLIEEPLALLAVATRVAADAIRAKAKDTCVLVTTASTRDATRVGDRIAVLADGVLTAIEESNTVSRDAGSLRVVVAKSSTSALLTALGADAAVGRIDTASYATGDATALTIHGDDLAALAKAVTRAIAQANVDVELVEPSVMPLDAIRTAIALAAAASAAGGAR